MDLAILIPTILIIIGSIVMALNIVRSLSTLKMFCQFVREDTKRVKLLFRIHEILMLFFLIGYIVVAYATITQIKLISALFVGLIFFFGALFVMLGIMLQTKMISSIKKQYDKVISIREVLKKSTIDKKQKKNKKGLK